MYYITYNPQTNRLIDISNDVPSNVEGTTVLFDEVDLVTQTWSPEILNFVPRTLDRMLTKLKFLERFTISERIYIRTLVDTDPIIDDIMQLIDLAEYVDLDDANTIAGLQYLMSINVINQTRYDEIIR